MSGAERFTSVAKRLFDSTDEAPSRHGGLAYGLEGWAWVLGSLTRAGLFQAAPAVLDELHQRMASLSWPGEEDASAALLGPFGQLLSLAALSKVELRFRSLLRERLLRMDELAPPVYPDLKKGALGGVSALLSLTGTYRLRLPGEVLDTWYAYGAEVAEAFLDTTPEEGVFLGLLHGLAGALAVTERLHRRRRLPFIGAFRRHAVSLLMGAVRTTEEGAKVWPILTNDGELTFFATCAGAPGITAGLCAARAWSGWSGYDAPIALGLGMLNDPRARRAFAPVHSLCCGRVGEAHALAWIGHLSGQPRLLERARRLHASISLSDVRGEARLRKLERSLLVDELGWLYAGFHLRHPDRLPYIAFG